MIIVLAKTIPKDESAKASIIEFSKDLIKNSKLEEGNIDYSLFDDTSDDSLMFVEKWESIEILQKHMQTKHFLEFGQKIGDLVSGDMGIEIFNSEKLEF
ncbi:putative quinol monooxygenase [Methanobrevibacter sp.]|uniref:putative quinol monooxygenase n=1 Tax=Methanobrevibacter sp. TaxID=66852 RepID=UPI00388E675F